MVPGLRLGRLLPPLPDEIDRIRPARVVVTRHGHLRRRRRRGRRRLRDATHGRAQSSSPTTEYEMLTRPRHEEYRQTFANGAADGGARGRRRTRGGRARSSIPARTSVSPVGDELRRRHVSVQQRRRDVRSVDSHPGGPFAAEHARVELSGARSTSPGDRARCSSSCPSSAAGSTGSCRGNSRRPCGEGSPTCKLRIGVNLYGAPAMTLRELAQSGRRTTLGVEPHDVVSGRAVRSGQADQPGHEPLGVQARSRVHAQHRPPVAVRGLRRRLAVHRQPRVLWQLRASRSSRSGPAVSRALHLQARSLALRKRQLLLGRADDASTARSTSTFSATRAPARRSTCR